MDRPRIHADAGVQRRPSANRLDTALYRRNSGADGHRRRENHSSARSFTPMLPAMRSGIGMARAGNSGASYGRGHGFGSAVVDIILSMATVIPWCFSAGIPLTSMVMRRASWPGDDRRCHRQWQRRRWQRAVPGGGGSQSPRGQPMPPVSCRATRPLPTMPDNDAAAIRARRCGYPPARVLQVAIPGRIPWWKPSRRNSRGAATSAARSTPFTTARHTRQSSVSRRINSYPPAGGSTRRRCTRSSWIEPEANWTRPSGLRQAPIYTQLPLGRTAFFGMTTTPSRM